MRLFIMSERVDFMNDSFVEAVQKALNNFSEAIKEVFEGLKQLWNQIKEFHVSETIPKKKQKHSLIKKINLQSQVIFRKPKFIKARSNL